MSVDLIEKKISAFPYKSIIEQEHAIIEILQKIILLSLCRSGFFRIAAFESGSCLRILHGLGRFSSELEFSLKKADPSFSTDEYIKNIAQECDGFGFSLEKIPYTKKNLTFIKKNNQKKYYIPFIVNTSETVGARYISDYIEFPVLFCVTTYDMPTLFARSIHKFLCFMQTEDFYDIIYFLSLNTTINFSFLQSAIDTNSPWAGQNIKVTPQRLTQTLKTKIQKMNFSAFKEQLLTFLPPGDHSTLDMWSIDFCISRVEKILRYHESS